MMEFLRLRVWRYQKNLRSSFPMSRHRRSSKRHRISSSEEENSSYEAISYDYRSTEVSSDYNTPDEDSDDSSASRIQRITKLEQILVGTEHMTRLQLATYLDSRNIGLNPLANGHSFEMAICKVLKLQRKLTLKGHDENGSTEHVDISYHQYKEKTAARITEDWEEDTLYKLPSGFPSGDFFVWNGSSAFILQASTSDFMKHESNASATKDNTHFAGYEISKSNTHFKAMAGKTTKQFLTERLPRVKNWYFIFLSSAEQKRSSPELRNKINKSSVLFLNVHGYMLAKTFALSERARQCLINRVPKMEKYFKQLDSEAKRSKKRQLEEEEEERRRRRRRRRRRSTTSGRSKNMKSGRTSGRSGRRSTTSGRR
jgi:hypothetical protein